MRKVVVFVLAAALAIFMGSWPAQGEPLAHAELVAQGGGGHGGFSGGHSGGFRGGGGGGGFRGGHGGGHFRGGVWFGPGWWWDPFLYPYYPYPYYPYYDQAPVVIQQQPEYLLPEQQPQEASYWYFCRNPKGYYPYVKKCPGGWLKVVPAPAPPGGED
jgi:hypothetical protein